MRVALVLRSAEVQPLFRDLCIRLPRQAECQFFPPLPVSASPPMCQNTNTQPRVHPVLQLLPKQGSCCAASVCCECTVALLCGGPLGLAACPCPLTAQFCLFFLLSGFLYHKLCCSTAVRSSSSS